MVAWVVWGEAEGQVNVLALKHEGISCISENFLKPFSSCPLVFEDGKVSSLRMIGRVCVCSLLLCSRRLKEKQISSSS